ncbi:3-hydroxyacyl-CoA dehydrogenase NAD-binding domain-containing protein, partial [Roseibium sp.]
MSADIPQLKLAVLGLGYVGLPVAAAFAARGFDVVGFDISERRLAELNEGTDSTASVVREDLLHPSLRFSGDEKALRDRDVLIVAVPTPVDQAKRPDLTPFESA